MNNNSSTKNFVLSLDYYGKRILSNKDVLVEILKRIFPKDFLDMSDDEIKEHLKTNNLDGNFVDLKTQEVFSHKGKHTRFDLNFEILRKTGRINIVNLELQRQRTEDLKIRAVLYPSKIIAEQSHKEYSDFNEVISTWINLNPKKERRNTIIKTKFQDFLLEFDGNHFTEKILYDESEHFDLMQIVQINVGTPKDKNFNEFFKFLYDLFHNNVNEVKKYYLKKGKEFNLEEIVNPMMFYETLDEQARNEGRIEGIKEGKIEGIKEGKIEGIKEGKIEGIKEGSLKNSLETAKRMLKDNISTDFILTYFPNLTLDILNSLQKDLIQDS